jgi:hypothetical protein
MQTTTQRLTILLGMLLLGGPIALALLINGSPATGQTANQRATAATAKAQLEASVAARLTSAPKTTVLSGAQQSNFAVLSANTSPIPATIAKFIARSRSAQHYGLNTTLARPIGSQGDAWVIPGQGELCLWITDPVDGGGIGCATTSQAIAGELSISLLSAGTSPTDHIVGLLPNGVTSLTLSDTTTDATTHPSITAAPNSWETTIPDGHHQITFDIDLTQHTISAP